MKKKNILVLSTLDERGKGHGWSHAQNFKSLGHNVQFLCLLRTQKDTPKGDCIIDSLAAFDLKYILYKLWKTFEHFIFAPFPSARGRYKGVDFASYKDILKRLRFNPDYVIVCTFQQFLSPRSLFWLYKYTNATFVFVMCDEKILGGGCPYPMLGCKQYNSGCNDCPYYPYAKWIPRRIYREKVHYFNKFQFHLMGVRYDLEKARQVPFLKEKQMHPGVENPSIPFFLTKDEARRKLNVPIDHFVIMCGAVNVNDWKKGFKELVASLKIFADEISVSRSVTLIVLSKTANNFELPNSINIRNMGFLDLEGLFSAYYACDVYVSPSIMDSGPMMVNYSLACGRPVIAFPVGVAIDLVVHKKTGWLAEFQNIADYAKGLDYFYHRTEEELVEIEQKCKKHIIECSQSYLDDELRRLFVDPVSE